MATVASSPDSFCMLIAINYLQCRQLVCLSVHLCLSFSVLHHRICPAGLDGQYGLGRRSPGGMSMSTGDLAALYEAQLNGSQADLLAAASSGNLQALNSMSTGNLRSLATSNTLPQSQASSISPFLVSRACSSVTRHHVMPVAVTVVH